VLDGGAKFMVWGNRKPDSQEVQTLKNLKGDPETYPVQEYYRYAFVGVIATKTPIPEFDVNEKIAEGGPLVLAALVPALQAMTLRDPAYRAGDASNVLVSLGNL
jgi:hypothetical protein